MKTLKRKTTKVSLLWWPISDISPVFLFSRLIISRKGFPRLIISRKGFPRLIIIFYRVESVPTHNPLLKNEEIVYDWVISTSCGVWCMFILMNLVNCK